MKKIMVLLLLITVLSLLCGCAQKTETNLDKGIEATAPIEAPADADHAVDTSEISNDIDSISKEIANIDVDDLGDVITPIGADDLTTV